MDGGALHGTSPRFSHNRLISDCFCINALIFMEAPHFGHSKGSISNTRFMEAAQKEDGRSGGSISGSGPGKSNCKRLAPRVRAE